MTRAEIEAKLIDIVRKEKDVPDDRARAMKTFGDMIDVVEKLKIEN